MYSQGDILLIPIPFSDLTTIKKRPVMVLSNNRYNTITDDVIVIAITSNIGTKYFEVQISNDSMLDGEIKVKSSIRVDKIYTISQSIVIKRIGRVKVEIIDEVKNKLMELVWATIFN